MAVGHWNGHWGGGKVSDKQLSGGGDHGRDESIPGGVDGGVLVLGLGSTEHLVNVLMGVPNQEEAQEDILKDVNRPRGRT